MFHLDLKQVDVAIAAGRLDEAFSLLKSSSARSHREGQRLVDLLIELFVVRGNEHFDEQRLDDAWHDAEAAAQLGGRQIKVARLLECVRDARLSQRQASSGSVAPPSSQVSPLRQNSGTVLQVDGLGSLLVIRSERVSLGASASSQRYNINLLTEGTIPPIHIVRDGEDYFVKSDTTFFVNGRSTSNRLLSHGDTVAVGNRGRLRFLRPVAASGSAVLEISGVKLARGDIRRVVLMADSLLFGDNGCHFRLPVGDSPVIMQPTSLASNESSYLLQHQGGFDQRSLTPGGSVRMDDIRFALTQTSSNGASL